MILNQNFFKSIPLEKKEIILSKMYLFEKQLSECKTYTNLPKGFWVRRIEGTNIFKFRITNGDRILFKYSDDNSIIFIAYRTHDKQILTAKNTSLNSKYITIDTTTYDIAENEEASDLTYIQDEFNDLGELNQLVLEDDYIYYLIDENDSEYLKHISEEQFEVLKIFNKPIFLNGCAGSGKSIVGVRRLLLNEKNNLSSLYVTHSKYLKINSKTQFENLSENPNKNTEFKTIHELCFEIINSNETSLITLNEFALWLNMYYKKNQKLNITTEEIWYQIINVLKSDINPLSKDEYTKISLYDFEISSKIYSIFNSYETWLAQNGYKDEITLTNQSLNKLKNNNHKKYDFIVIDEMQDMTDSQINLILKFRKNKDILFIFDENQVTRFNEFNIGKIKSKIYDENTNIQETELIKNYRNTKDIDNFAKAILSIKNKYVKFHSLNLNSNSQREGKKPIILKKSLSDLSTLIDCANNNSDTAIIVWDEQCKEDLSKNNLSISRVFTVDEIKGLDYKTIICLNLLSNLQDFIKTLKEINKNNSKIIEQKINSTYVSLTRARNILCLVEDETFEFDKMLSELIDIQNEVDLTQFELDKVVTPQMWLKEAEKLELNDKFVQASEAYKKAGNDTKAEECKKKSSQRKIEIRNQALSTAIRIESTKNLKFKHIQKALKTLEKTYDVEFTPFVEIAIFNKQGTILNKIHLVENDLITEISNICVKLLETKEEDVLNLKKLTLHITLLKDHKPQELSSILKKDLDTVILNFNSNNRISIVTSKTKSEEQQMAAYLLSALSEKTEKDIPKLSKKLINDFQNANNLFEIGNYKKAQVEFKKLLDNKKVPDIMKSSCASTISGCKFKFKEFEDGAYYGELAIELDNSNNDGYINAATNYLNIGEYEKALTLYKSAKLAFPHTSAILEGIRLAEDGIKHKNKTGFVKITPSDAKLQELNNELLELIKTEDFEKACKFAENNTLKYNLPSNYIESAYSCIIVNAEIRENEDAVKLYTKKLEKIDPNKKTLREFKKFLNNSH